MAEAPIVFDGTILGAGPHTGVAGAFLTTLTAYVPMAQRRCVLVLPPGTSAPSIAGLECLAGPRAGLWRWWGLAGVLRRVGAALLHVPVAALPRALPCPAVATIHDLPWASEHTRGEAGRSWRHRRAAGHAMRHAATVIVPSVATFLDLTSLFSGRSPVAVIRHGVPPASASSLDGPLLAFGDGRPRKNLARLQLAYQRARQLEPRLPELAILGPGTVRGYVCDADKQHLLASATALIAVSLHEGFGLPVLEAFARGIPVLCSNRGALAELAGSAALTVNASDVEAIAQGICRIVTDRELRQTLHLRGLQRATEFTPACTANAWLALHRQILAGAQPP